MSRYNVYLDLRKNLNLKGELWQQKEIHHALKVQEAQNPPPPIAKHLILGGVLQNLGHQRIKIQEEQVVKDIPAIAGLGMTRKKKD